MEEKRLKTSDYLRDISTREIKCLYEVQCAEVNVKTAFMLVLRVGWITAQLAAVEEKKMHDGRALAWLSMPVVSCKNMKNEHCLRTPESTYLLMTAAYGLCALVNGLF